MVQAGRAESREAAIDDRPPRADRGWRPSLRAAVHQIISFAEMIAEDGDRIPHEEAYATATEILRIAEAALPLIGNTSDPQGSEVPFGEVEPRLSESSTRLLELADKIAGAPPDTLSFAAAAGDQRIAEAAREFSRAVKEAAAKPPALPNPVARRAGHDENAAAVTVSRARGLVLVVDDDEDNRDVLSRRLLRDGCEVMVAAGGRQAIRMLHRYSFDLVLLDIMMPGMDGYAVLAQIKSDPVLSRLPVIMITAVDDMDSVVRCLEMGADDYLLKPFNRVLLRARVNALLERKRLQDEDGRKAEDLKRMLSEIEQQRKQAQVLLENILPQIVADELRGSGTVQPMYFEDATIAFADIVGFTLSTELLPADELVAILHEYFTAFDRITEKYRLEKLKTIGDCYMFAAGLPVRSPSNPVDSVLGALEMVHAVEKLAETGPVTWRLRIGVNTGPVIAGVVGIRKFAFDIWGDAVNFAARLETAGQPNRVNLSASTFARVKDFFDCEKQEKVRVKEGREVDTYLVKGLSARLLMKAQGTSPSAAFARRYATYFRKDLNAFPGFLVSLEP